jgi:hypothetical protein
MCNEYNIMVFNGLIIKKNLVVVLGTLAFSLSFPSTWAEAPQPIDLTTKADVISDVAVRVKNKSILAPQSKIVIDGKKEVDTWLVSAKELVFKPGAELIFSSTATAQSHELFIVADSVVIENPMQPPRLLGNRANQQHPIQRDKPPPGLPETE